MSSIPHSSHYRVIADLISRFSIDTPGVIDRVSTLFRGHPSLIQGFNTFLPPGYRIECRVSTNADGTTGGPGSSNIITVTTPMGVTTRTQNVTGPASSSLSQPHPAPTQPPQPSTSAHSTAPPSRSTSTAPTPSAPAAQSTSRLPPLPSAPAPPRPISPPAPIPPFGSSANSRDRAGTQSWQQQQSQQGGVYGSGSNGAARARHTSQGGQATANQQSTQSPAAQRPAHQPSAVKSTPVARAPSQEQAPSRPQSSSTQATAPTPATPAQQQPAESSAATAPAQPQIMEFNHAITYVNKIKTRFAKEPETYKTFLEILQTYQKDGRPIQEVSSPSPSFIFLCC